jgi:GAF domain-containing protein
LQEIDTALTSTLDLQATLQLLMEKIELVLPGAVTIIRLMNKETGNLEAVASHSLDAREWRTGNPSSMGSFAHRH